MTAYTGTIKNHGKN